MSEEDLAEIDWEKLAGDSGAEAEDAAADSDDAFFKVEKSAKNGASLKNEENAGSMRRVDADEELLPQEANDEEDLEEAFGRDSGFRRLSTLVILPFKESARRFVATLLALLPKSLTLQHERYHRFCERFGTDETAKMTTPKTGNVEFDRLFSGDTNDDFWCGVRVGKRGLIFCENWTNSDFILISPLRLKLTMAMDTTGKRATHLKKTEDRLKQEQRLQEGDGMSTTFNSAESGQHPSSSSSTSLPHSPASSGSKGGGDGKPTSTPVESPLDLFTSIEVCVLWDITPSIELQNITHVLTCLSKLNKPPSSTDFSSVDFSRLRFPYLYNTSQYFRQMIFVSKFMTPLTKHLFEKRALNLRGRVKIRPLYSGVLSYVIPSVEQTFLRFDVGTVTSKKGRRSVDDEQTNVIGEARLNAFRNLVLPVFRSEREVKTLIFVSDYFDFLRLRNLYKDVIQSGKVGFISEYSEDKEVRYLRRQFEKPLANSNMSAPPSSSTAFRGVEEEEDEGWLSAEETADKPKKKYKHKSDKAAQTSALTYLIVTERYYFYNRSRFVGASRVVFYSLPVNGDYYCEVLNWLQFQSSMQRRRHLRTQQFKSLALYCQFDSFALERVVGTQRSAKLITHKSDSFTFT